MNNQPWSFNMTDAYSRAKQHLDEGIKQAEENNVDLNAYGQALDWKLIERYQESGRPNGDIVDEIQYSLDNIADDNTFHVSRN
jgi:flagellar biosynthesis/type III secretory pathway chaperone